MVMTGTEVPGPTRGRGRVVVVTVVVVVGLMSGPGGTAARAQLPVPLPSPAPPAKGADADKEKDKVKETEKEKEKGAGPTVATPSGPIKVVETVDDEAVEHTLETLLPKFPGVRSVDASVHHGVAALDGRVDDDDTRDQMTKVTQKVEGVNLVINRLQTDAEVMSAPELVLGKLSAIWDLISRRWLLALLALGIVLAFSWLARLFNVYAETLLAPFVKNVMLRSVVGSLIGGLLLVGGVVAGLSVLNLTRAVASVLGVAGVVGLAVGFAFKDITENFIASVLLGLRRPFRVGDYITVAGQSGVVKSLNTRATVLVTLEGNHVRIPNNVVYKEILVNATASPTYRASFDVVIPYEASTSAAADALTRALRGVDGVQADPPARALVEALEPGGVRLRAYYWVPVHGVDWFKLNSDAKLSAKVALQTAGALAPPAAAAAAVTLAPKSTPTPAPAGGRGRDNGKAGGDGKAAAAAVAQAEANLRRDARAAADATAVPAAGETTPMQHVLNEAETRVSEEGTNLLAASGSGSGKADG